MEVWPNPTRGQFAVRSSQFDGEIIQVEILDIQGKIVESNNLEPGTWNLELDISYLTAGIYICRLYSGDQIIIKKIILTE